MTTRDADTPDLLTRTREALTARGVQTAERRMFGETALMVDAEILVSTRRSGGLLVRCPRDEHEALTALPGAQTARMGQRSMGAGWIEVDADSLTDAESLGPWLDAALRRRA